MSDLIQPVGSFVRSVAGRKPESCTAMEIWTGLSEAIVERIADNWERTAAQYSKERKQHYFSAEFLMGRALLNNLTNLSLIDEAKAAVEAYGFDLSDVLEEECDASLGNGGLGRLAACFLDSCATQNLPAIGYGILYRYGLFKQSFKDGFQAEAPDPWMEEGYPFVIRREEEQKIVHFADMDVRAIPYDMPITGYGTKNVGTLRLWKAEPMEEFDYEMFNSQRFTDAIVLRERVNDLSRVLYPNDTTFDGKVLRLRQQYFFVSAALQEMIDIYKHYHGTDLTKFADFNCVQLNDTHPVVAIPELMRLLMDDQHLGWDEAWEVVTHTFAYTNHTVLAEALETWDISIFERIAPRVLEIIYEIDRRFREDMQSRGLSDDKIHYLSPVHDGKVHMAWIACYAAFSINGVAALHTEILKRETLADWYSIWPQRFNNKTNGVTPRRWLRQCNPKLADLLTEITGSDAWVTDLSVLKDYRDRAGDDALMGRLNDVKSANKHAFAEWLYRRDGIKVNPDAIFDVQIKRLHEYKRQLMNALYILDLYFRVKEDPSLVPTPRLFVFGAKAAPGYRRAKAIIKFINTIGELINGDPEVNDKLQVVFIENYAVTPAEHIIPATDISEQISTAGKEASGTSNMKFMMNGALTLGTLDGANVEIVDSVGLDNAFIFGAKEEELGQLKANYDPRQIVEDTPGLARVIRALVDGSLNDGGTGMFHELRDSLMTGIAWEPADVYYVLGDFAAYRQARDRAFAEYEDRLGWARKCWVNIVESGRFSSDRTIRDYATEVWKIAESPID